MYKKYIKKNGQTYGPYYYESFRKDGKVINRYVKSSENPAVSNSNLALFSKRNFLIFGLVILMAFTLLLISNNLQSTGKVSLDIATNYLEGENLQGHINFGLVAGELIPSNSKVILQLGGVSKEFLLSDIVSEDTVSGNFFASGASLSGSGEGYGVLGSKITYPEVDFELKIFSSSENNEGDDGIETPTETPAETPADSETAPAEPSSEETLTGESTSAETTNTPSETSEETAADSTDSSETSSDSADDSGSESSEESDSGKGSAPLTGSVISESENERIVSGSASKDNDYSYALQDGENAEIVPGSVSVDGIAIGDNEISLDVSPGNLVVSTDYSENEEGFGAEYNIGDTKTLSIDISKLDISASSGTLVVQLVTDGETLTSSESEISVEGAAETVPIEQANESAVNETSPENITTGIFLIKQISSIRIAKNGKYELNLSDYFSGATSYSAEILNVSAEFNEDILTLRPELDIVGLRRAKIIAYDESSSLESNLFNILISSGAVNIDTSRGNIKVGERVKWIKNVSLEIPENITIELPKEAENISVVKVEGDAQIEVPADSISITGNAISGFVTSNLETDKESAFARWFKNLFKFGRVTGNVVEGEANVSPVSSAENDSIAVSLEGNATQYVVEYYTDAPIAIESDESYGKKVVISGPDGLNYTDVLSFTNIPEDLEVGEENRIRVYWRENESYVNFDAYDSDGNEKLDYVEWITPHLSNQTFEIIFITGAEHLDENRAFIEDIYELVKERDGNWTNEISAGHYIRVTFEKNLTSEKDITIYARSNYSNASVEVYEKDKNDLLEIFDNVSQDGEYKIYLMNLTGEQDTFDLRITGNPIEFDYIVDPNAFPGDGGGATELRAQVCNNISNGANHSFGVSCDGTYPAACPTDLLSCNDGSVETHTNDGDYAGVKITTFNSSITDCASINQVFVCHEMWVDNAGGSSDCTVEVSSNGGSTNVTINNTCPGATADPGIICQNATSSAVWNCTNFFGSSGTRAIAQIQLFESAAGPARTLSVDALFFNVSYTLTADTTKPLVQFVSPTETSGSKIARNNILVNVTASDASLANITIRLFNSTGSLINSSNKTTSPLFTNFSVFSDGVYYFNATALDLAGNSNSTETRNVTIDRVAPQWSNPAKNTTLVFWNESVGFNTTWSDDTALFGYIFALNQTGSYVNSSFVSFTGTSNVSTNISLIDASAGTNVTWLFFANDSAGNSNQTSVQSFVVQSRNTSLSFAFNQSVYAQGSPIAQGIQLFVPFEARFIDNLTSSPIPGASCSVINNMTSDNVTLSYNSTTGNYTGQVNSNEMGGFVRFDVSCSRANHDSKNSSAVAEIWLIQYLWDWENKSYGALNNSTNDWLRRETPEGAIANYSTSLTTSILGENLAAEFAFYASGINGSFLRDHHIEGPQTLRLNVSISNGLLCSPYLCHAIKDFNLNTVHQTCGAGQTISSNTPTMIENNITDNKTIEQDRYSYLQLYLNCTASVSEDVSVYYNYTGQPANVVFTKDTPTTIISSLVSQSHLNNNFSLGPNSRLNLTGTAKISFNNTASSPRFMRYVLNVPVLSTYPNSILNGTVKVFNSTGNIWASDNASAGAPNTLMVYQQNNQVDWITETIPANTKLNETIEGVLKDALRDNETLIINTTDEKAWNISVFTIFVPQISISNVTVFTNYSTYGVEDNSFFVINFANSSGTFDISNQSIVNTATKIITFPNIFLSSATYSVSARDRIAPTINFTSPTETSGSKISRNNILVNVTVSDANLANITIRLFNSSRALINSSNSTTSPLFTNFSVFSDGVYYFNATAFDTAGNSNSTETRNVTIDSLAPVITNLTTTPSLPILNNGSVQNISVNFSSNEFPINITFRLYNSTGALINLSGPISVINSSGLPVNFSVPGGLSSGNHSLNMTFSDSVNNTNTTFLGVIIVDTISPVINNFSDSPDQAVRGSNIEFEANVTDNLAVNSVTLRILGVNYTMFQGGMSARNTTIYPTAEGTGNGWTGCTDWNACLDSATLTSYGDGSSADKVSASSNFKMLHAEMGKTGLPSNTTINYLVYNVVIASNTAASGEGFKFHTTDCDRAHFDLTGVIETNSTFQRFSQQFNTTSDGNNWTVACIDGLFEPGVRASGTTISGWEVDQFYVSVNYNNNQSMDLWFASIDTHDLPVAVHNYTIYANDSAGNSAEPKNGTFNLTGNNVPTHGTPILNSTFGTNTTNENLTVYNVSTSDADGDSVVNIYDWRIDSESMAVLNMPFEAGTNNTYAKDFSTNNHEGNASTITYDTTGGKIGGAYLFNGADDSIIVPDVVSLEPDENFNFENDTDFTLEAWIKSTDSSARIFNKHNGSGIGAGFYLGINAGKAEAYISDGANVVAINSSSNINDSVYHHIAAVFTRSGNVSLYMDGIQNGSAVISSVGNASNNQTLVLGSSGISDFYLGSLDEVKIYHRALSLQQIRKNSQADYSVIVSQELQQNEVWEAAITPSDSFDLGTTLTSNSVTIADQTTPLINFVSPTETSGTTLDNRSNIAVNVTASDLGSGLKNITIRLYNSTMGLVNSTNSTTSPFFVNFVNLTNGIYFFNATAFDNSGNSNSTETRNVTIAILGPNVTNLAPAAGTSFRVNETVNITATVLDGNGISAVLANITLPNGTVSTFAMSTGGGGLYNLTFGNLEQKGNYSVQIIANDTFGSVNSSERTSFLRVVEANRSFDVLNSDGQLLNFTQAVLQNVSGILDVQINFTNQNILTMTIFGFNESASFNLIRFDNSSLDFGRFDKTFAIDLSSVSMINANITATAVGNTLYKCLNYTFLTKTCNDGYDFLTSITPGQNYTFTLNATDPGFGDQSPDAGTPDSGAFEAFADGFSSVVNTFTAMQADDATYFAVRQSNAGGASLDLGAWLNVSYNITNLTNQGITPAKIRNLSFFSNYCFNNDISGAFTCGGGTVGGAVQNPLKIQIFNKTSGQFQNVSTYIGNETSSAEFNNTFDILSGFADFVDAENFVRIRYEVNVSITVANNDAAMGVDLATLTVTFDIIPPNVTDLRPVAASNFSIGEIIEIAANVTDNVNVSAVVANITLPNGTINQLTLILDGGTKFNNSFSIPSLIGRYNVTVIASDTGNNVNASELTFFNANDTSAPLVQFVSPTPANNSFLSQTSILVNVTAIDPTLDTLILRLFNSTGLVQQNTSSTSPLFVNFTGLPDGQYLVNASANDSAGNVNHTGTRTISIDTSNPQINFTSPTENNNSLLTRRNILVNVTASDANLANITIRLFNSSFALINSSNTTTSPLFTNFSVFDDGVYYFNATVVDLADNSNSTETRTISIDTSNPQINFTSPTENNNSLLTRRNILVNVTASDVTLANITIRLFNSSFALINSTNSTISPLFTNFSVFDDGVYYFNATAFDIFGNSNNTETRTVSIDTVKPQINFTSPTENNNSLLTRRNILVNVTASDANLANITIRLFNSSFALINSSNTTTSPLFTNFSVFADGTYYFNATALDIFGNSNNTETRTISIDTSNPQINFTAPTPVNNSFLSQSSIPANVTASDLALDTITLRLFNTTGLVQQNISLTSPLFVNFTGLPDGQYFVNASANDTSGNSNSTETRTITLDTARPLIQFVSPTETSGVFLGRNNILVNVTATDTNLLNVTIFLFNSTMGLINSTNTTTSPNFINFTSLADGLYFFNSTAIDRAGNTNSTETRNVTINTQAPQIQFVAPTETSGSFISRSNILVNTTASDSSFANLTIRLFNSTGLVNSTTTISTTLFLNFTPLADGIYFFNATAVDLAGNSNSTETRNVTIDNVFPAVQFVAPTPANGSLQTFNSIVANVTASDLALDTIILRLFNSTGLVQQNTSSTSPLFVNFTGLPDGQYFLNASANDSAGNVNHTETRTVSIDTVKPQINFTSPTETNNSLLTRRNILVNVTASDANLANITIRLFNSSFALINSSNTTTSPLFTNFSVFDDGVYYFNATAFDIFGNSNNTETRTVSIDTVNPQINFTSPTEINNSILPSANIIVNVTASDSGSGLKNITIRLFNLTGSLINSTNSTISPLFVNFSINDDGIFYFNATAFDNVGRSNSTETRTVTIDNVIPSVFNIIPVNGSEFNLTEEIEIAANATNGIAGVNSVLANVTLPNGTIELLNLSRVESSSKYNTSFEIPELLGAYNVSFFAIDNAGNINDSERTNFSAVDRISPVVSLLNPGNGVNFETSTTASVNFQYSVTEFNISNCTLVVNSTNLNFSSSVNTSSGAVNIFVHQLGIGSYSWNVTCIDAGNLLGFSETRTFTIAAPTAPAPSAGGGGGGGGYAIPVRFGEIDVISVDPDQLNVVLLVNSVSTREITITNTRDSIPIGLSIELEGEIASITRAPKAVYLEGKEQKTITLTFGPTEKGLLTGMLVLSSGTFVKKIPIVINVKSQNFLFDASISIAEKDRVVEVGDNILSQVHLIQVGAGGKVDVTATYVIKDFAGKNYFEERETFFVLGAKDYVKSFSTKNLPPGKYIVGLEIVYPGAFATSSAQFEVVEEGLINIRLIILISLIGIIGAGLVYWIFLRERRALNALVKG